MLTREMNNFHNAMRELATERMEFILSQLEEDPYIFNRSIDEVRDYLYQTAIWTVESNPNGVTYDEYIIMWNNVKENYCIREFISKERAISFCNDLRNVLYKGNTSLYDSCSIPMEKAADLLAIPESVARKFYMALRAHRITECQGNGLVF